MSTSGWANEPRSSSARSKSKKSNMSKRNAGMARSQSTADRTLANALDTWEVDLGGKG